MNLWITCENLKLCYLLQVWFTDWEPLARNILSHLKVDREAETSTGKVRLRRQPEGVAGTGAGHRQQDSWRSRVT